MPRQINIRKTAISAIGKPLSGMVALFVDDNGYLHLKDSAGNILPFKISELIAGNYEAGDYSHISQTGELRYHGAATVWDDIVGNLIGRTLFSTAGTLDYNFGENAIVMQRNGNIASSSDRLIFNFQKPHGTKQASEMRLHIHWQQPDARNYIWTVQYRIQDNFTTATTAWQTVTSESNINNARPYPGSGVFNQITKLINVDMSNVGISSTVEFRVCRTDANTSDILVKFVDAHIEWDGQGSEEEYEKY